MYQIVYLGIIFSNSLFCSTKKKQRKIGKSCLTWFSTIYSINKLLYSLANNYGEIEGIYRCDISNIFLIFAFISINIALVEVEREWKAMNKEPTEHSCDLRLIFVLLTVLNFVLYLAVFDITNVNMINGGLKNNRLLLPLILLMLVSLIMNLLHLYCRCYDKILKTIPGCINGSHLLFSLCLSISIFVRTKMNLENLDILRIHLLLEEAMVILYFITFNFVYDKNWCNNKKLSKMKDE